MNRFPDSTHAGRESEEGRTSDETLPDVTPRREGGDDALAESSPVDSRSDEKVIAQHKSRETANEPSRLQSDKSGGNDNDDKKRKDDGNERQKD